MSWLITLGSAFQGGRLRRRPRTQLHQEAQRLGLDDTEHVYLAVADGASQSRDGDFSGNDLKSNRGRYTREWLAEEAIRGIHRAITTWKESSPPVSVVFVFLGSWKLHGAGFFDVDREHAQGNYERCKKRMLAIAGDLNIPTWDESTDTWEKFEKTEDGWHFTQTDAPKIAAELRRMLGDVLLHMEAAPVPPGPQWNDSLPQRRNSPQPQLGGGEVSAATAEASPRRGSGGGAGGGRRPKRRPKRRRPGPGVACHRCKLVKS